MKRPWLILDRDDTILDDPGYLSDPDQVKFLPGALEGLKRFYQAGWPLVVVTNQSGLGRGYFSLTDLQAVHKRFEELLRTEGVELAGIYFCPHAPEDNCECRKPKTLLAERAASDLGLALQDVVMIGDKDSDLQLGLDIGARGTVQITAKRAPSDLVTEHFDSLDTLADSLLH